MDSVWSYIRSFTYIFSFLFHCSLAFTLLNLVVTIMKSSLLFSCNQPLASIPVFAWTACGVHLQFLWQVYRITVPRRLFFAAQQRIAITRKPINIKRSAVQWGDDISRKISEMSNNFGEIIKKLYFLVSRKPARGLPMPSPPSPASILRIFHVWTAMCGSRVKLLLAEITRGRGGGRAR